MTQPRGSNGRFGCDPHYPRLRVSPCGCAAGADRPCPVAARLGKVRAAAKAHYRPAPGDPELAQELESDLYALSVEREGVRAALDWDHVRLTRAGGGIGRVNQQRGRFRGHGHTVMDADGNDSEDAYDALVVEWRELLAHDAHLITQGQRLGRELRAARGMRPLTPHKARPQKVAA